MTMNTAQRLVKLKGKMCDNLTAMGVQDLDETQTIIELSDEILNIPPTVVGIDLDTTITCSSDKQDVIVGDTVTFTGTLKAFYDDETLADVDLEGVLQGATVKIYDGNTLLGTATTNQSGIYSYTYTVVSNNDLAIKAVFDGTNDYKSSYSSTIVINIVRYNSIALSAQKSVLSYIDSDKTDLYAQLQYNGSDSSESGVTITFYETDSQGTILSTLGTAQTDNSGKATLTDAYTSVVAGDVYFKASDDTYSSSIFTVKTVYYANTGVTDKTSDFDLSNVWVSKNSSQGTITFTNDNGWIQASRVGGSQYAFVPISKLTGLNQAFKMSMIIDYSGSDTGAYAGFYAENYQTGMFQYNPFRIIQIHTGSSDGWSVKFNDSGVYGSVFKYEVVFDGTNFTHSAYNLDGTLIRSRSWTMPSELNNTSHTVRYGLHMEYGRKIRFKDLIVELL